MTDLIIGSLTGLFTIGISSAILWLALDFTRMRIIRFRPLNGPSHVWYIAFSQREMDERLAGELAEVVFPAKPWLIRIKRKLFPLKGITMEVIDER